MRLRLDFYYVYDISGKLYWNSIYIRNGRKYFAWAEDNDNGIYMIDLEETIKNVFFHPDKEYEAL